MKVEEYLVTLTKIAVRTWATSSQQAVSQVLEAERAPESALICVSPEDTTPEMPVVAIEPQGWQNQPTR